jgi:uncharacterized membrane protein YoaK (UPF0700 family)
MQDSPGSPPTSTSSDPTHPGSAPSVDSRAVQTLLVVLSVTAGSIDIISFLGLNGLFTAHITGNLVILAAHIVVGDAAPIAPMLSVPMFILIIILTRVLADRLESMGFATLRPLLVLQFILIAGFLILGVAAGARVDPNATDAIIAGMLGVAAMAVQNALVQISLKGAPSTAAMTSNVTRFAMDLGDALVGSKAAEVADARKNAARTLPSIVGFAAGCGIGAACEARFGLRSLALPASLALIACVVGFVVAPAALREKP